MSKINARKKGNSYELQIIEVFKNMGWTGAVSSRSESKRKDDQGVDICHTDPLNIQCKAVETMGSAHAVLAAMPKCTTNINVVFHKKNRQGTVVSMGMTDFIDLLNMLITNQIIKPQ